MTLKKLRTLLISKLLELHGGKWPHTTQIIPSHDLKHFDYMNVYTVHEYYVFFFHFTVLFTRTTYTHDVVNQTVIILLSIPTHVHVHTI